jgi:hypothetical protein
MKELPLALNDEKRELISNTRRIGDLTSSAVGLFREVPNTAWPAPEVVQLVLMEPVPIDRPRPHPRDQGPRTDWSTEREDHMQQQS